MTPQISPRPGWEWENDSKSTWNLDRPASLNDGCDDDDDGGDDDDDDDGGDDDDVEVDDDDDDSDDCDEDDDYDEYHENVSYEPAPG